MTDIYITAVCPLRHQHRLGMKPVFQQWLDTHPNTVGFELSRCPLAVELEPDARDKCPNCGQPYGLRRTFCCAYPLEDDHTALLRLIGPQAGEQDA